MSSTASARARLPSPPRTTARSGKTMFTEFLRHGGYRIEAFQTFVEQGLFPDQASVSARHYQFSEDEVLASLGRTRAAAAAAEAMIIVGTGIRTRAGTIDSNASSACHWCRRTCRCTGPWRGGCAREPAVHDIGPWQGRRHADPDVHEAVFQRHSGRPDRQLLRLHHRQQHAVRWPHLRRHGNQRLRHQVDVRDGHRPAVAVDQPRGVAGRIRRERPDAREASPAG